jgi:hypothetical protein
MTSGPVRPIIRLLDRLGPVGIAFFGSVLLSVIAISGSINPNNDGMLYIEAAGPFQNQGLAAARQAFDWLFFPVLIATISSFAGLGLESSAYLICALMVAGLCALIVACSRHQFPDSGWAACVVILALPALNSYRDHIIREFGCWFFLFLAFYLVLRWVKRPDWRKAIGVQGAIGLAALFRPEALVFIGVLILWQLLLIRQSGASRRLAMMSALPIGVVLATSALLLTGAVDLPARIITQISSIDPVSVMRHFTDSADRMAAAVLNKYSADEAQSILFFGMISIIPVKFFSNLGVFVIPLVYGIAREGVRSILRQWSPLSWMWAGYLVVLTGFLFKRMFLTGRYVGLLDLLVVPLVAIGIVTLFRDMPRWRWLMVIVIGGVMMANVVTTSPKKIHHPAAAEWLAQQQVDPKRVYIEDGEIAYLAGLSFSKVRADRMSEQMLAEAVANGQFDLVLVRASAKNQDAENWASINGLEIAERFYDARGRGVLVLRPRKRLD